MIIDFTLNGKPESLTVPAEKRLPDILREDFKLTMTSTGCRRGECGVCLVLLNGRPVSSCLIPAFRLRGNSILTIEGFQDNPEYFDIIQGFLIGNYEPCEHCLSSRILAVHALLEVNLRPTEQEIIENVAFINCRCTDFSSLCAGIAEAGRLKEARSHGR
ncbi:MAG: 2Fe-2S iron-sulfur cluster binding domain-containing protein [Spirochaetales bacterium]|jgi:carbon-monoxide dehydrogenase small subunit|nr:2Fe-2S iron-sulfur cluster binding domain-containing protein [Spirochaetales bacterium]